MLDLNGVQNTQFFSFGAENIKPSQKLKMNIILSTEGNKLNEIVQCIKGKV